MVGLILFGHDGLAKSFLDVMQAIVGPQKQVEAVDVATTASSDEVGRQLDQAIKAVDNGHGVVILADLFGGSPANFSLARMVPGKVEVISGLNLAMLLKMIDLRTHELSNPEVMARAIAREGRDNIVLASEVLVKERVNRSDNQL
ncbi:MAG: PTS sugar transporter subunit IIA [Deltaproteobacteria bacterium]|nr:PTS sugar transporter subunit IIA [Deltaproteobacteria bacterium]MBW1870731.1 PTS sugar transporter subunit IIA [Deltaproteobacteria bacterium]